MAQTIANVHNVNPNKSMSNFLSTLSFVTFNIEGLWSMVNELDLAFWVRKYDLVVLVETFTDSVPDTLFPTHDIFVCPGVKISDSVHGRLSGGIAILVRTELRKYVERIFLEFDNIIALKMSHTLLGSDKDFIFIGAYLPPEQSKYYEDTDIYNGVMMLEDCLIEINSQYDDSPLIICGDLNSRTASRNSNIWRDPIDDLHDLYVSGECDYDNDVASNERFSKDMETNSFGRYLLNVCNEFSLSIVNGLKSNNFSSDFTYISPNGCSVIDLFVLSNCLLDKCFSFKIHSLVESKHAAVELSLCTQQQQVLNNVQHNCTAHSFF